MKFLILILFTLLHLGCNGVFYQPSPHAYSVIDKSKLDYRDIYYGDDGQKLHGRLFPHKGEEPSKGLIVHFHGNAQNLSAHFLAFIWVVYHGYDYFIWDYSGYGQSTGSPSREQLFKDGLTTMDVVMDSIPSASENLYVFAQSLGGAVAVPVIAEWDRKDSIDLLLIDASFSSYQGAARGLLSSHWVTWVFQPLSYLLVSDDFAPAEYFSKMHKIPIVVSHCEEDRVVSYELGMEVYSQVQSPKALLSFDSCGHIGAFSRYRPENQQLLWQTIDSLQQQK
ncbi:MAG: alpha/beta hydrolase [Fibrobacterales bacterium]